MGNGIRRIPVITNLSVPVATTTVQGTVVVSVAPASATNPIALGQNDPRVLPSPSTVGKTIYDNGSAYVALANGTTGQVLTATTSAAPSWTTITIPSSTPGFRNYIVNGNGAINQRFGSTNVSASGLGPDRWRLTLGTGAAATLGRSQNIGTFNSIATDISTLSKYYMTLSRTTAGSTATLLEQRIENVRTLAGSNATLSFYAKSADGATPTVILHQNFGTGGLPSSTVDTTITSSIALTTSWAYYSYTVAVPSIVGKTNGNNFDDYLGLEFQISSAQSGTRTMDIGQIQLEAASTASAFEIRPIQTELALCQRYHCNSFGYDTAEAQNAGLVGCVTGVAVSTTANTLSVQAPFPVMMRAIPTITTYNTSAAAATWFNATASIAATAVNTSRSQTTLQGNAAPTAARVYNLHWSADAEL